MAEHTPRGYTRKPCPGCGGERLRPTSDVCDECSALIADGKLYRAEAKKTGTKAYSCTDRAYALPYIKYDSTPDHKHPLQEAFMALIKAVGADAGRYGGEPLLDIRQDSRYSHDAAYAMRPDQRDAIDALYKAAIEHGVMAYREGFNDGRSLIMQLAAGSITVADIEDRTLRVNKG